MIFLILYLVFALAFATFSAIGFYHLTRYGYSGDFSKIVIAGYSLVSLAVIVITFILLAIYS